MRVALLVLIASLAGCPKDHCVPNTTRCFDNQAQICGSDENWRHFMSCDDLGSEGWSCCMLPENPTLGVPSGHGCYRGECPAVEEDGG